jgi:hypothetical protein
MEPGRHQERLPPGRCGEAALSDLKNAPRAAESQAGERGSMVLLDGSRRANGRGTLTGVGTWRLKERQGGWGILARWGSAGP